jgi:glucose/arabinose dehydrogenase/PKD repeat protein
MPSLSLWRRRAMSLSLGAVLGVLASASVGNATSQGHALKAQPRASLQLPTGFTLEVVASSLNLPTAFVTLPDGRILIAEKDGVVRLYKDGALQPTPFMDIRNRVSTFTDRGLLGLAADPDFATNGYIYLLYTYENDATDPEGPKTGRLARYTAEGDSASPDSEFVLLGTQVGTSCNLFPPGADCIPSDSSSHSVGQLKFAPDGTLFVTLGDGAGFDSVDEDALRAQDLDSLAGKLLHISRTGQGVPSNPFWNEYAGANRSKVWSYGLRNAYRFNLRPGTNTPYLGDVGWNTWEEINVAGPGANLGWPCYEGPEHQPGYEPFALCQELYAQGPDAVTMPLYAWQHDVGRTSTGGGFYMGTSYPEPYRGAYFFGDYSSGWIASLKVDAEDHLIPGSVSTFATDVGGPVDLELGPDTDLYDIDILAGELRRFTYSHDNTPPTAVATANPLEGHPPLSVQFSSAGSSDPDGDPLQYTWDFGDGSPLSSLTNPEHLYETAGVYLAVLTVSDGRGGTRSETVRITVGNFSPVPTITSPSETFRFRVGDVVTYAGSATDPEDGPIPDSHLSWTITLHHCTPSGCHTHPYSTSKGPGGTFDIADHGDEIFFELTLTATDSAGSTGSTTRMIYPQLVQLTLQSDPPGRQVVLDGTSGAAPLMRAVIVGSSHTLYAPSPQSGYLFQSWSDDGEPQHTITVGTDDVEYTASFGTVDCPVGEFRAEYFNTQDLSGWPALVRCETAPFSYDWGEGSPAPEVNADQFSVRWTGQFSLAGSLYTFTATADDGVRVYVDSSYLIDAWRDQGPTTYRASRWLAPGQHTVVMEYYENGGGATAALRWNRRF